MARFDANVAAIETLQALRQEPGIDGQPRLATLEEKQVLARWSGWGASGLADVFDESRDEHGQRRARLRGLLSGEEYDAAKLTTINAHYTDPMVVRHMWTLLGDLGFDSGNVLEPGCGAGTFIGMAPSNANMYGVELDPTTAAIAQALYPQARIRCESFADSRFRPGLFDAAIGNVPFSKVQLVDPLYNSTRQSMHNHFLIKSLALVRPGGMAVMLTSAYTMDAENASAREEMHELADLVGAIRLPNRAFARSAGTDVMIDMLLFRRRVPGEPFEQNPAWLQTNWETLQGPHGEEQLAVNKYFLENPNMVLGTMKAVSTQYGVRLGVEATDLNTLPESLTLASVMLRRHAKAHRMVFSPRRDEDKLPPKLEAAPPGVPDGHIGKLKNASFGIVEYGEYVPLKVPKSAGAELGRLLQIRDSLSALMAVEADPDSADEAIKARRADLRGRWEQYVKDYGPLNRYTPFVTAADKRERAELAKELAAEQDLPEDEVLAKAETLVPASGRRTPAALRLMAADPAWWRMSALEVFDEATQQASPGVMLLGRQIKPAAQISQVESVQDALNVVLDRTGQVDLAQIAELAGVAVDTAVADLGELIWQVPRTDEWVTKAEYLSGDVRKKLEDAILAETAEPGTWQAHVEALRQVQPEDILPGEIGVRPGAVWIPESDHQEFLRWLLRDDKLTAQRMDVSNWRIKPGRTITGDFTYTELWGTRRKAAHEIFRAMMEQRPIQVTDYWKDADGQEHEQLNEQETDAATEKAEKLDQAFKEWIWENPERTVRLVREYNRRFNSHVGRDYRTEGERLSLPGLSPMWQPYPHQRDAVARMLAEPSVGLFHQVGAGKTMEMCIGAVELKRLGMIQKPAFVVPNHMLNQFTREFLQFYPQANVIAASAETLSKAERTRFVARIAQGDYDAVIMTYGAFTKIPLQPKTVNRFIAEQVADLQAAIDREKGKEKGLSVKKQQAQMLARMEKIKGKLLTDRDPGVSFEESGIDYLFVDELHSFKNLTTFSQISDGQIEGSQRAMDLLSKVDYLRRMNGKRVMTGATATPIANSVSEMHVMLRYLTPETLRAAGVYQFDEWAATFAQVEKRPEFTATGDIKFKNRLAKFVNVPELQGLFRRVADVKRGSELGLKIPATVQLDGQPGVDRLVLARSEEQRVFFEEVIRKRIRDIEEKLVEPDQDNHLTVHGDGRRATLDMRLVDPRAQGGEKIDAAADIIHQIWAKTKDWEYSDPDTGQPYPGRGALQMVFCDQGVPNTDGRFSVYTELKQSLVDRGIPAEKIRFIQDAKTNTDKERLFEECRNGNVAVLIGSTTKMGVGTNIQRRAIHLLHLDPPWRPADVEQREGRILRQGNLNPEVHITTAIATDTYDTFMWQTISRKADFIGQLMNGGNLGREVENLDDETEKARMNTAVSTSNPLLMELIEAEQTLRRFTNLERDHDRQQKALEVRIANAEHEIAKAEENLPLLREALAASQSTKGDAFHIKLRTAGEWDPARGRVPVTIRTTSRSDAAQWLEQHMQAPWELIHANPFVKLGGLAIELQQEREYRRRGRSETNYKLALRGVPGVERNIDLKGNHPTSGMGMVTRMENMIATGISAAIDENTLSLSQAQAELEGSRRLLGKPFVHQAELEDARETYLNVKTEFNRIAEAQENLPPGTPSIRPPELTEETSPHIGFGPAI
ncbi:MAG: DEAD/DEAH box helicase family protein [Propionibacteriaceae bacterium]|nr:DEAD/DEAH box helicase family protein [Propionibacteriaceae bacterium]